MVWVTMPIGSSVYITVIGLLLWSFATIFWAVRKNREEERTDAVGRSEVDR